MPLSNFKPYSIVKSSPLLPPIPDHQPLSSPTTFYCPRRRLIPAIPRSVEGHPERNMQRQGRQVCHRGQYSWLGPMQTLFGPTSLWTTILRTVSFKTTSFKVFG